jgi:hypothetical protein
MADANTKNINSSEEVFKHLSSDTSNEYMTIADSNFLLPDMGEYMKDNADIAYLASIDEKIGGSKKSAYDLIYYREAPFSTELGYHAEEKAFVIKAVPIVPGKDKNNGPAADALNEFDGDTVYFPMSTINDGGTGFEIGGVSYSNFKQYANINTNTTEKALGRFGVRFLGINCPEVPHYRAIAVKKSSFKKDSDMYTSVDKEDLDSLRGDVRYVYDHNNPTITDGKVWFFKSNVDNNNSFDKEKFHEIHYDDFLSIDDYLADSILPGMEKEYQFIAIVSTDETEIGNTNYYDQGMSAKNNVKDILGRAEDIAIVLDASTINKASGSLPTPYDEDMLNPIDPLNIEKQWAMVTFKDESNYRKLAYNAFGQDVYRRYLGVIYAKVKGEWINLSKYVLAQNNLVKPLPDYTSDPSRNADYNYSSDAFRLWSYDPKSQKLVDSLEEISKSDYDDRMKIQRDLGYNFESLKDWTVMVGDCLLMVPPTSIRLVTQTTTQKQSLIRAKGSLIKGAQRSQRLLELTIYFNGEEGINGAPYVSRVVNKDHTYYMNGLRSLISMFKLTPFLPIENDYINKILNIEAVSLVNMQITTLPNYPQCVAATLTLEEFAYRVYMPELPVPDSTKGESMHKNMFASCISFETMRWYYQQPLIRGNELKAKNYDAGSTEYINATFGNKTVLQPMEFGDSSVNFFVVNKEYLDQQKQIKLASQSNNAASIKTPTTETAKIWRNALGQLYTKMEQILDTPTYEAALGAVNSCVKSKDKNNIKGEMEKFKKYIKSEIIEAPLVENVDFTEETKRDTEGNYEHLVYINVKIQCLIPDENALTNFLSEVNTNLKLDNKTEDGRYYDIKTSTLQFVVYSEVTRGSVDATGLPAVAKGTTVDTVPKPYFEANSDYTKQYTFRSTAKSVTFLKWCNDQYTLALNTAYNADEAQSLDSLSTTTTDYVADQKQATDIESVLSLKYDHYPLDYGMITIKSISCVFGNTLSRISLQAQDGFAPQYVGGQDTMIEVAMQTTSEDNVTLLNHLPKLAAMYARDYRVVLNSWPIRIDSQLTRLLGINEVLIESVDVSTVPGQPGLFNISMRLISVDRTLRNREALKRLEVTNNSGSNANSVDTTMQNKTFFDLKRTLSKAEVYPDLELPTIQELAENGFKFIRYSGPSSNRIYPDPDFYFVYGHILGYEVFRSGIITFLKEEFLKKKDDESITTNVDGLEIPKFDLYDKYGAKITIEPRSTLGYTISAVNDNAKTQKSQQEIYDKVSQELTASSKHQLQENAKMYADYSDIVNAITSLGVFQTWDVAGDSIKCIFREKKYLSMFKKDNDSEFYENVLKDRSDALSNLIDDILSKEINYNSSFIGYVKSSGNGNRTDTTKSTSTRSNSSLSTSTRSNSSLTTETRSNTEAGMVEASASSGIVNTTKKEISDYNLDVFREGMLVPSNRQLTLEESIDNYVNIFFKKESGSELLNLLGVPSDSKDKVIDAIKSLIKSAACASTGSQEYDTSNANWKSNVYNGYDSEGNLRPVCSVDCKGQGQFGIYAASDLNDAITNGIMFGPFGIRTYTKDEMYNLFGDKRTDYVDGKRYFLDPYYRSADSDTLNEYKKAIMMNPNVMVQAFVRIILFWIKKLVEDKVMLSIYDIVMSEAKEQLEKNDAVTVGNTISEGYGDSSLSSYIEAIDLLMQQKKYSDVFKRIEQVKNTSQPSMISHIDTMIERKSPGYTDLPAEFTTQFETTKAKIASTQNYKDTQEKARKSLDDYKKIIDSSKVPVSVGQLFVPILMALTDGDQNLYSIIQDRNYEVLNSVALAAQTIENASQLNTPATRKMRKLLKALVGYKYIKTKEIGTAGETDSSQLANLFNERVYLAAAENPAIYLQHSFYDMIVNDKRGRMLRAFPTYYMMFIDEGREIGMWKLHDNFYNMSAISEMTVTKSRKIAADTASITMSNMFNSYTTDDEDIKSSYEYTAWDAFDSIFSPRKFFLKEEAKREAQQEVNRVKLKAGARIHLRMGYGADAAELPAVFNGVVAEVSAGESVELICQGDGVELSNPILSTVDAEDIQNKDDFVLGKLIKNWITNGATPRTILGSLLTTKGGWLKKEINKWTDGRFFNDNPYGIVHFGEPMYKAIFQSGEVVQNIYEASSSPQWSENDSMVAKEYRLDDVPKISTTIFGKSYWDIMHVCASASPDFIASVVPFGFRSSIFYGAPRYYCAYDYEKDENGTVKERRKPFQQFHIYTSYSDIIGNSITASEKDVRTCAMGIYSSARWLGSHTSKRVGPMWADFDIYPEKQKTMTVDTQFLSKGTALGDVIPFLNLLQDEFGDTKGVIQGGYQIAWRMTANALKQSVMDMYQGDLMVIGDPSIKPYDRVWIEDSYERMQGNFQAEAVVHTLSGETGFTTSIYADCITTIDDKHEQITQHWGSKIVAQCIMPYITTVTLTSLFAGNTKPLLTAMAGIIGKGGKYADSAVSAVEEIIGKEGLKDSFGFADKVGDMASKAGISSGANTVSSLLENFRDWDATLSGINTKNVSNVKELGAFFEKFGDEIDKLDPSKLKASLEELYKDASVSTGDKKKLAAAIKEIEDNYGKVDDIIAQLSKVNMADIDTLIKKFPDTTGDVNKFLKLLKKNKGAFQSVDDIKAFGEILGKVIVEDADTELFKKLISHYAKFSDDAVKSLKEAKVGTSFLSAIGKSKTFTSLEKLALGAKTSIAAVAIANLAEFAIVQAITAFAYEYVERWARNLRVLQIFPLKKDGNVLTAGLDGSKGIVYGSPSWEDNGMIQNWLINLIEPRSNAKIGGVVYNVLVDAFLSTDLKETIDNFKKKTPEIKDMTPDDSVAEISDMLKAMASDELLASNKYRAMLFRPRIDKFKSTDGQAAIKQYAITDTLGYEKNKDITENMVPVGGDAIIQKMIKEGKFVYVADEMTKNNITPEGWRPDRQVFNVNGTTIDLPIMVEWNTERQVKIIDVPFLRPEAYGVLTEIIDKLKEDLEPVTASAGAKSGFLEHPVTLMSALRVGDNSVAATGYSFKINVTGYDKLGEVIKSIEAAEKEAIKKIHGEDRALFVYREISSSHYEIVIYPPKVKSLEGSV